MGKFIQKPVGKKSRIYPFRFPEDLKYKSKLICIKRDIPLAKFVREGIVNQVNKYEHLLKVL